MAGEDYEVLHFNLLGQLGLMGSSFDLKCTRVDTGLISMVVSKDKKIIPGVESIVCEFGEVDMGGAISHDFAVLNFEYFIGLGINFLSKWIPGYDSYQKDKWEEMVSEIKKLPAILESSEKDYPQESTSMNPNPKVVQLPQSLIKSCEFLGPEFLEWLQDAALKECPICDEVLKTGEDVATLVYMKRRKLSCSTGINNGVYHVSHTRCLISWILMSEFMIDSGKRGGKEFEGVMNRQQLDCVMCPECQGSQGKIRSERPRIPLNSIATLKTKACYSYKEWLESQDEWSDERAIGLSFPMLPNDGRKMVIRKRLPIYKAG